MNRCKNECPFGHYLPQLDPVSGHAVGRVVFPPALLSAGRPGRGQKKLGGLPVPGYSTLSPRVLKLALGCSPQDRGTDRDRCRSCRYKIAIYGEWRHRERKELLTGQGIVTGIKVQEDSSLQYEQPRGKLACAYLSSPRYRLAAFLSGLERLGFSAARE